MRTKEQIANIKSRFVDPYAIEHFISDSDVSILVDLFENYSGNKKIHKNTGPITLNIPEFKDHTVFKEIFQKIEDEIGKYEIVIGFYFSTDTPHIIHNDDTFELPPNVYRGITIPLKLYNKTTEFPKLCFFDQFYFHGPAKFFKGSSGLPTYYNQQIYDYSDIDGLVNTPFESNEMLTHLYPQWLEGLSLHSALDWIPGNALIFDSVRLHCASDFRKLGITRKLGLSIFTKIRD
jgi:hypothetical protein